LKQLKFIKLNIRTILITTTNTKHMTAVKF